MRSRERGAMRAARFHTRGGVRVEEVQDPSVGPRQVQIAVDRFGMWGRDLHEYFEGPIFIPPPGSPHPLTGEPAPVVRAPGIVGTDMWYLIDEKLGGHLGTQEGEALAGHSQLIALGRVQTAEDVAGFVSCLAGPDVNYMTDSRS